MGVKESRVNKKERAKGGTAVNLSDFEIFWGFFSNQATGSLLLLRPYTLPAKI